MEEMLMLMTKEEVFDDTSDICTQTNSEEIFYKDVMAYDAMLRLEQILN